MSQILKKPWKNRKENTVLQVFGFKNPVDFHQSRELSMLNNKYFGFKKGVDNMEEKKDEGKQTIAYVKKTNKGWSIWLPDSALEARNEN